MLALAGCLLASTGACLGAAAPSADALRQELRELGVCGSVLYVAAHPDDENTQLITYLARGRDYRTAYLSLTRGDGGQNVLGPEFGDTLGVIRTQELLAARRLDGGEQFFSRARDFGFSKDYRQTLGKWDRQQVLSDIVRVLRTFRPDVVITRFSPEPGGTHGHHTASAALAVEAFALAGDPKAFPEQLDRLAPWSPKRILWNAWSPGRPGAGESLPGALHMNIDGTDAVSGASFAELAARSRSMHATQGFANFSVASSGGGPREESFKLLAGDPAAHDIMDGVDTTWGRFAGGAGVGALVADALARFDPGHPAASVPALLEIRGRLARLPDDPGLVPKRRQLDHLLQACLGLTVETRTDLGNVVPGESVPLTYSARATGTVPVSWVSVATLGLETPVSEALSPGVATVRGASPRLPATAPLTQPYWLSEEPTPGMFRVGDAALIGRPESPTALPVEYRFTVGGQTLVIADTVRHESPGVGAAPVLGEPAIVAPVSLGFDAAAALFSPGAARPVVLEVTGVRAGVSGTARLEVPAGWSVSPASRPFRLAAAGDRTRLAFQVTPPASPDTASIQAVAEGGSWQSRTGRIEIAYPHIPRLVLQPAARLKAVCLELAIRGRVVGYVAGAGDSVSDALRQMGYRVVALPATDLTADGMKGLDAVVIGVRALNTRPELAARMPALFAYAEAGGTVVEQYNTPGGLVTPSLAPFDLKLSRELPRFRVTDEHAAMTVLLPGSPALAGPNVIVPADFEGWVQERGLNFPSEWDAAHFEAPLACSDVGEAPLRSGLLVAHVGKGYFVYTGLSFFRQLPAGVPGAYRLFANLVSLGK